METVRLEIGVEGSTQNGSHWENLRTVEFDAGRIASRTDTDDRGNRGVTETLYRTADERLIVYVEDWSRWQGETSRYSLCTVTEEDLDIDGAYEQLGREAGMTRTLSLDEALEG